LALPKYERIEKLMRAVLVREGELRVATAAARRAEIRRASLEAAVTELRETVRKLIEGENVPEDPPSAALEATHYEAGESGATNTTIADRVLAFVDGEGRTVEAADVAQTLGVNIDTARTTLSKLHAKGILARPKPGLYRSLSLEDASRNTARAKRGGGGG